MISLATSSATSILRREQGELLFYPILVRIEARLLQPRAELLHVGGMDRRDARRDAADLRLDVGAAGLEQARELLAFAGARRRELLERAVEQRLDPRTQLLCRHGRLDDDAGPAHDLGDRQRRRFRDEAAHDVGRLRELGHAAGIDGDARGTRLASGGSTRGTRPCRA